VSDLSDHYPVIFHLDANITKTLSTEKFGRQLNSDNIRNFGNALKNLNWHNVIQLNDAENAFNEFSDTFNS